jgi:hypothetical protein
VPTPNHDAAPTTAVYARDLPHMPRPPYALRIYDTTPSAADPGRVAELARVIRQKSRGNQPERIEVVGLPVPIEATDEERSERCWKYQVDDMAVRGDGMEERQE